MTNDLFTPSVGIFASASSPNTDGLPLEQIEKPAEPARKRSIGNDKDRLAMWGEAGADSVLELYKNDPLIRASLDAQFAQELQDKAQPKESNMVYDSQGNLLGIKSVGKAKNTDKGAAELMAAIRQDIARKYRITE
ncbi:hypothetical protein L2Y94_06915 [Luteibacter aegosomatis]|uniref:hypothetical protein n=1 Tax=Luteibacter aegosomatis TaxID=2911537 RepID=UPI001FF7DC13|nr:hypothetical protein [Luteibacter aegosomatis]UPG87076.1 hypothetical protein L2Y94_06915 [Luteibacter aegosomatis]